MCLKPDFKILESMNETNMGESPGVVVMGGDSCSKGRDFESQHRKLDRHDIFIFICCKNCNDVCLKRQK